MAEGGGQPGSLPSALEIPPPAGKSALDGTAGQQAACGFQ
jgi:hypothetical protein